MSEATKNHDSEACTCATEHESGPCPYDQEIEGEDRECNCCAFCRKRCAEEI
jgi:hypothetical protein